jgi:hypothetical protein
VVVEEEVGLNGCEFIAVLEGEAKNVRSEKKNLDNH